MKGLIMSLAMVGVVGCSCEKTVVTATSPDGRNEIRLYESPLSIEVLRDGKTVVGQSRIGVTVSGEQLDQHCRIKTTKDLSEGGSVKTPVYKKASVNAFHNLTMVKFGDWRIYLAARNDGVAYHFEMRRRGRGMMEIQDERTDLSLPADAKAIVYKTKALGCEESVPQVMPIKEIATSGDEMVYLPFVYTVGGTTVAITESDLCDYPCWYLKKVKSKSEEVKSSDVVFSSVFSKYPYPWATHRAGGWDRKTPIKQRGRWEVIDESTDYLWKNGYGFFKMPWRVFVLADEPSKLCESDIVFALARPPERRDWSWVKPGKVAWDWWNAFDNQGDDGCNTKTYERFIDFASRTGVEYVIFDEGWSEALNIWKFHPNVDVPHLVKYAAERNVGIILWMAWGQIVGDEAHVAEEFAKLGVKGFKVDFMDRGDAQVERFLWDFAHECAKHKLVIDYHGAHRPTGMSRTYPNVLNYEGIHGLEQMKWFRNNYDMAANDVACFFGRLTAGPMDYTPGAMDNYPVGKYPQGVKLPNSSRTNMYVNPGSEGTRCHQMAMMTMYEAPLQMLSDSPTKYEKNMECFRFMAATPVVWADTVGLGGDFDTYAACARKAKDGSWFAAALNNATGRVITVDTAFLGAGEWKMEIFRDAEDANANPTHFLHETKSVKAGEKLTIALAKGGGFAAKFTR